MLALAARMRTGLADSARTMWDAGWGTVATVQEGSSHWFERMVRTGEVVEATPDQTAFTGTLVQAKNTVGRTWRQLNDAAGQQFSGAMRWLGVPTRDEIGVLAGRIETLHGSLEALRTKVAARSATDRAASDRAVTDKPQQHKVIAPEGHSR